MCEYIYIYASQVVLVVKIQLPMQEAQESRLNAWVGQISWSMKWQPIPAFLPGKFHGQRSLAIVYGAARSTTRLSACTHTHISFCVLIDF